jgi:hypothetical protein
LEKISLPEIQEVEDIDETVRGEGGFGSTGQRVVEESKNIPAATQPEHTTLVEV